MLLVGSGDALLSKCHHHLLTVVRELDDLMAIAVDDPDVPVRVVRTDLDRMGPDQGVEGVLPFVDLLPIPIDHDQEVIALAPRPLGVEALWWREWPYSSGGWRGDGRLSRGRHENSIGALCEYSRHVVVLTCLYGLEPILNYVVWAGFIETTLLLGSRRPRHHDNAHDGGGGEEQSRQPACKFYLLTPGARGRERRRGVLPRRSSCHIGPRPSKLQGRAAVDN